MTTYAQLAKDNQYLYGQMENCTQLMGLALLNNQEDRYKEYLKLRDAVKDKIEINLRLIEDIWYAPVIERPALKRPVNTNFRNECNVIKNITAHPEISVRELAKKFCITEVVVKNIIEKYNLSNKTD